MYKLVLCGTITKTKNCSKNREGDSFTSLWRLKSEIGTPDLKFGGVGEAGYSMPSTENSGA